MAAGGLKIGLGEESRNPHGLKARQRSPTFRFHLKSQHFYVFRLLKTQVPGKSFQRMPDLGPASNIWCCPGGKEVGAFCSDGPHRAEGMSGCIKI